MILIMFILAIIVMLMDSTRLLGVVVLIMLFLSGCGPRGDRGIPGDNGVNGAPGSGCSVVSETYGALIVCFDGTSVQVHNGTNGVSCAKPDKDNDKSDSK